MRRVLHIGCGPVELKKLPVCFHSNEWQEVRLDIDPRVKPDIVANMMDMAPVANASMDAIWSSHNLEHLNFYEVPRALSEFKRVLRPDGFALITLPDLKAVAKHIIADRLTQPLYHSLAGPITPMDIVFGHQASMQRGNHFMAHRTGFTATTLGQALLEAGFHEVRVHEGRRWDLWAIAVLPEASPEIFNQVIGVIP